MWMNVKTLLLMTVTTHVPTQLGVITAVVTMATDFLQMVIHVLVRGQCHA